MVRAEVPQGVRQMRSRDCSSGMNGVSCRREKRRRCWGCRSGRFGAGVTGCGIRGLKGCAIGGSANRRAAGRRPRSSSASATSRPIHREPRSRSERAFRTLQDRLPKELDWPVHNAAFAAAPAEASSAFVADRSGRVRGLLCVQEERRVGNDNTIKWRGLSLQIPPSPLRPHFVRATVPMHDYPDGRLTIFHGPHRLADYGYAGNPCDGTKLAA